MSWAAFSGAKCAGLALFLSRCSNPTFDWKREVRRCAHSRTSHPFHPFLSRWLVSLVTDSEQDLYEIRRSEAWPPRAKELPGSHEVRGFMSIPWPAEMG